jgi:hypothetical protein
MIKIQHSGLSPHKLSLMIKNKSGDVIVIDVEPNHFFYADTDFMTRPMIIYEKKKQILITHDNKPLNAQFYTVYSLKEQEQKDTIVEQNKIEDNKEENIVKQEVKKGKAGRPVGSKGFSEKDRKKLLETPIREKKTKKSK